MTSYFYPFVSGISTRRYHVIIYLIAALNSHSLTSLSSLTLLNIRQQKNPAHHKTDKLESAEVLCPEDFSIAENLLTVTKL